MSPYPFLLIIDGLSILFKEYISDNEIKGVMIGKTILLSHLLFVDVVLLLYFGDESDLRKSLQLLDLFCVGIGMDVSYNKSACYYHNIDKALSSILDTFFAFDRVDLDVRFK